MTYRDAEPGDLAADAARYFDLDLRTSRALTGRDLELHQLAGIPGEGLIRSGNHGKPAPRGKENTRGDRSRPHGQVSTSEAGPAPQSGAGTTSTPLPAQRELETGIILSTGFGWPGSRIATLRRPSAREGTISLPYRPRSSGELALNLRIISRP